MNHQITLEELGIIPKQIDSSTYACPCGGCICEHCSIGDEQGTEDCEEWFFKNQKWFEEKRKQEDLEMRQQRCGKWYEVV